MANNPRVTELNDQIKVYDEALARLTAMRLDDVPGTMGEARSRLARR